MAGRLSTSRNVLELLLRQKGAKDVKKNMTLSVTHLVVYDIGNIDETNSKVVLAKERGLEIVDEAWVTAASVSSDVIPMLNFNVMLAKSFKHQNVDGWWCSEKLDGIRAVWDGSNFWSRSGNRLNVPIEWSSQFPQVVLDGEIFGGRGNFQSTSGTVRTKKGTYEQWRSLDFHVFDAPDMASLPFEKRQVYLQQLIRNQKHLKLCEQQPILTLEVPEKLAAITAVNGEGLMLRKPKSLYIFKRTSILLKVKKMQDAEAVVIGYEYGSGRNTGICGSLVCEYRGKMFKCGSGLSDQQRRNPPQMGSSITFGYFEMSTSGVPRFPTFKRVFVGRL